MNNKKYQKKKIQDTDNSGFGKYREGVGGGASPNDSTKGTHGHGANSDYRKENNDTMQARTADGKFTYKSVNGQSIDPKYGPSRGKTVNPLLTGGKNGVKIDNVEKQFSAQSGEYWDKYKDKWYTKGGEMALQSGKKVTTHVSADAIWNVAKRRYDIKAGEFKGESNVFDETKKGRKSLEEKAALQKVASTGEEQAVIDKNSGGIKVKNGIKPFSPKPTAPTPAQPTPPTPTIPVAPAQPQPQPQPQPTDGVSPSNLKHSADEIKEARQALIDANIDGADSLTDEQIDELWDDLFESGDDDSSTEDIGENNFVPEESKEDSDTVKKIKGMGFNG